MKKIAPEVFHIHSKTAFAKEMQNALVTKKHMPVHFQTPTAIPGNIWQEPKGNHIQAGTFFGEISQDTEQNENIIKIKLNSCSHPTM